MRLSFVILSVGVGLGVWYLVNEYEQGSSQDVLDTTGTDTSATSPPVDASGNVTLAWGAKVSPEFRAAVINTANNLGIDPNWLMAVIGFETEYTFSPSIQNPSTGATGLIQFMPKTAASLGTSTDALASMSAVDQLSFVGQYFSKYANSLGNLLNTYLAVFFPRAIGQPLNNLIASAGSNVANSNPALAQAGVITNGTVNAAIQNSLNAGLQPGNVYVGSVG